MSYGAFYRGNGQFYREYGAFFVGSGGFPTGIYGSLQNRVTGLSCFSICGMIIKGFVIEAGVNPRKIRL